MASNLDDLAPPELPSLQVAKRELLDQNIRGWQWPSLISKAFTRPCCCWICAGRMASYPLRIEELLAPD